MYENLILQFIPYLKRMERIYATPYTWNSKQRNFVLIQDKSYIKIFRLITFLMIAHLGLMCWNILHVSLYEKYNLFVMLALYAFAVTFIITVVRSLHTFSGKQIAELHNSCLKFHHLNGQAGNNLNLYLCGFTGNF
jgi:hypothetical protein